MPENMRGVAANQSPFVTMREAAIHWGVSIDTVRRLIARGELRAERVSPRAIRIPRSELMRASRPVTSLGAGDAL